MREVLPRIEEVGAAVVFVLCQDRAAVARWLDRNPFPSPVVVDGDRAIAKAWGVYHRFGVDAFRIARPASFVVDGSGTVRFAFVASHQFESADVDRLAERLEALRSGGPPPA